MKEKNIFEFKENLFETIGKDSALLTAGNIASFNTMTISWGTMGVLWGKNVVFVFVRPTRYTYEFMEKNDNFTVTFFSESYQKELAYLGTHSGRKEDKVKQCNLTQLAVNDAVTFKEGRLVFVCKKIYYQDLEESKISDAVKSRNYPTGNYHRMYVGEIIGLLENEK